LTAVVNGIGPLLLSPDAHVKLAMLACFETIDLLRPEQGPAIAKFKSGIGVIRGHPLHQEGDPLE
jgi:hypothetical protein